jgi:hypothetical protein
MLGTYPKLSDLIQRYCFFWSFFTQFPKSLSAIYPSAIDSYHTVLHVPDNCLRDLYQVI